MQIEDLIELAKRVQAQQAEAQTVEVKAAHRALARKLQISLALRYQMLWRILHILKKNSQIIVIKLIHGHLFHH